MKLRHFFLLLVFLAGVTGFFVNALVAQEEDSGFEALYNGKDLTGWKTTGNWVVEDEGVLSIIPREGEEGWKRYDAYLTTEKIYDDFILKLEFKYPEGGNSGIYFNIGDPADPVSTGIEIQILDSLGKADAEMTHHDNGGVIKTRPPAKNMSRPAGEWNQITVKCEGNQLTVTMNGEQIHDFDLSAEKGTKDNPTKGYISLQDHGLPLSFRNVMIKEL